MAKKAAVKKKSTTKLGRKVKSVEEIKNDIRSKCLSIRTIINSSATFKLADLQPQFSKAMADELGVNHGRFLAKFRSPVKFSMSDIHRFANYTETDIEKLTKIINTEIIKNNTLSGSLHEFRDIAKLPAYNKSGK